MNTEQQSNYTHTHTHIHTHTHTHTLRVLNNEDGWHDLFNGDKAGILPFFVDIVQGGEGGGHGVATDGAIPAPREYGGLEVPEPSWHEDRGHLCVAPHR